MYDKENKQFYVKVTAYNLNKNQDEEMTFYGTTREQAEGRYLDWRDKRGQHYEIKTVQYGKTHENNGA